MTITLPDDLGTRIRDEARRAGIDPTELVRRVVADHLQTSRGGGSLDQLFKQWEIEDATDDVVEIARRNRELEELKRAINRNRIDTEGPGSRTPFR